MRIAPLAFSILIAGCSLVPAYEKPAIDAPQQWSQTLTDTAVQTNLTWDQFGSAQLPALVVKALAQNQDVEAAAARVEQARAAVTIAGGGLYPAVDASANAQRSRTDANHRGTTTQTSYTAAVDVSYEVDLWGRIRAGHEAAQARFAASAFDRETVALTVATETARNYLALLATQARLKVAQDNLAAANDLLTIISAQYKEGRISQLELSQQKVLLSNTQASIATLENTRDAFRNALAVLTGSPAPSFTVEAEDFSAVSNPVVALVQPADLITRRPDIENAEAALRAANFDVGAARAALFPSLTIGAGVGVAANPATLLTDLIASLAAPIFHGGALSGAVELSEAQKRELIATYRQIVLTSFEEVENALSALKAAQQRTTDFGTAAAESQHAFALAKDRYVNGAIDYQTLLNTQQSLFSAQDADLAARLDTLSATLDLFKALGGNGTSVSDAAAK